MEKTPAQLEAEQTEREYFALKQKSINGFLLIPAEMARYLELQRRRRTLGYEI